MKIELVDFIKNRILFRGSKPETKEDFKYLKTGYVRDIINLEYGFDSWSKGHTNHEQVECENVGITLHTYRLSDFTPPKIEDIDSIIDTILKAPDNVLVHCKHGKDRTGIVIAAYRIRINYWTYEKARDEMFSFGFHKFPYYFWLLRLKEYMNHWRKKNGY